VIIVEIKCKTKYYGVAVGTAVAVTGVDVVVGAAVVAATLVFVAVPTVAPPTWIAT
jgi:hypothetical protein